MLFGVAVQRVPSLAVAEFLSALLGGPEKASTAGNVSYPYFSAFVSDDKQSFHLLCSSLS